MVIGFAIQVLQFHKFFSSDMVNTKISGNLTQPGKEGTMNIVSMEIFKCRDKCIAGKILCILNMINHFPAMRKDLFLEHFIYVSQIIRIPCIEKCCNPIIDLRFSIFNRLDIQAAYLSLIVRISIKNIIKKNTFML